MTAAHTRTWEAVVALTFTASRPAAAHLIAQTERNPT